METKLIIPVLCLTTLFFTGCARLILGNEAVNEMSGAVREMQELQSDHNGLLFVTGKFASKHKRWPKNPEELRRFWSNPKNVTDQSAYRNLRFEEEGGGGLRMKWDGVKGSGSSISLPPIKK